MTTKEEQAFQVTKTILDTCISRKIIDMTANVGGDTTMFAKYFDQVIAIEKSYSYFLALVNNVSKFDNVSFYNMDSLEFIKDKNINDYILYFDPPWGGRDYSKHESMDLFLNGINIKDIITILPNNIAIKIPNNYNLSDLSSINRNYSIYPIYKRINGILRVTFKILIVM